VATERGFTLFEVMVALAIASLATLVAFRAIGAGVDAARTTACYDEALSRARSHLAAVGPEVAGLIGRHSGDDGNGYRWSIDVARVSEHPPSGPVGLFEVSVEISWDDAGRPHHVRLETRRAANPPAPKPTAP